MKAGLSKDSNQNQHHVSDINIFDELFKLSNEPHNSNPRIISDPSVAKLMLASGNSATIELIDLDTKSYCVKPFPLEYAQGGLLNQETILACNTLENLNCYSMSLKDFQSKPLDFNMKYRLDAHSLVLDTGELWITGGSENGTHFDDTTIVSLIGKVRHQFVHY